MNIESSWRGYWKKMRGTTRGSPPRVSNEEILFSWIGSFVGIGLLAGIGQAFFTPADLMLLTGSFGASAVLLFGAVRSPLAHAARWPNRATSSAVTSCRPWSASSAGNCCISCPGSPPPSPSPPPSR